MKNYSSLIIGSIIFFMIAFSPRTQTFAQLVTVFDPATYDPADLPEGMDIVEIGGTNYLQIVTDGWNSSLDIDPFFIHDDVTHLRFQARYKTGTSGYTLGQINSYFKLATPDWTEIGAIAPSANDEFAEYWLPANLTGVNCGKIQVAGQETVTWTAVSGDTVWIGKIRTYIDEPLTIVHPGNYESNDLNAGWEVVDIEGTRYFKAALNAWDTWTDFEAYAFPSGIDGFLTTSRYVVGTSGQQISDIQAMIKIMGADFADVGSGTFPGQAEFTEQVFELTNTTIPTFILQVAGQETNGWTALTGDTIYLGKLVGVTLTESDSLALVELYNATGGTAWNNNANWLTGTLDTWNGVTVTDGRVTELNLSWNNLNGQLPNEIGNLTQLITLNLSGNDFLTGSIPALMEKLTQLQTINFESCDLTGTFPEWITGRTSLITIDLSFNNFDPISFPDFSDLTNLNYLRLIECNFTGDIQSHLSGLTNLQTLDLSGNQNMSSGPVPDLSSFTNLTSLGLSGCNRNGTFPTWLGLLTNLHNLNLSWNNFVPGEIPDLTALSNLENLEFAGCSFTGYFPTWISSLTHLVTLNMSWNEFEEAIPNEINLCTSLSNLNLEHNLLVGEIPAGVWDLANLRFCYLNDNQLSGSIPDDIGDLTNLEILNLGNNLFSGQIGNGFLSLSSIGDLYLNNNQFSGDLPELSTITSLNLLNIQENKFNFKNIVASGLEPGDISEFVYFPQDTILGLEYIAGINALTVLDGKDDNNIYKWFLNLEYITGEINDTIEGIVSPGAYYSTVKNTLYPDLILESESWGAMEYSLTTDSLSLVAIYEEMGGTEWTNNANWLSGPLSDWYGVTLEGERVARLQLDNNNLSGELCNELFNLTALDTLDIQGNNNLSGSIPIDIGLLTDLLYLSLWNCNLSGDLPVTFCDLTNLTYLDLNNNAFTGDIPSGFGNMTNLTQLWLGDNQFSGSIPAEINNLVNLTYLDFRNLPLASEMPSMSNLTNLIYLDMRNCQLTGAISSSLSGLTNLQYLYIFANDFDPANMPDLSALTNLNRLYLYNCNLNGSIPTWIGSLSNLIDLRIQNNQLSGEIPSEIGNLSNLSICLLTNNQLEGSIPASIANLSNLRYLYLHLNNLSGDIPLLRTEESVSLKPTLNEMSDVPSLYDVKLKYADENKPGIESLDNLLYLMVYNNMFTFSNLEASDIRPGDITTYNYSPQDTILALEYISGINALTILDGKSANNTYQWYKDGISIEGELNDTLLLGNMSGDFECRVNNTVFTALELASEEYTVEEDPCSSIVLFDPETYNPSDLPGGMEIVEIEGTKYVQVVLNGWESFFYVPPFTIPDETTHLRFEAKFAEGTSGYLTASTESFFKFADAGWNTISYQYFSSNNEFSEYRIPVNSGLTCRIVQTAARETTGNTVLTGDTIWIGKIRAFIDNPKLVVNPANYETSDLPDGWEVVCIDGTKYFKVTLNGWYSFINVDPFDFQEMDTNIKCMAKYEVGTSGYDVLQINTFLKLSTSGLTEICAIGEQSSSEFAQYTLSISDADLQVGLLQVAGQNTIDWTSITGDTLYLGEMEAYSDLPVLSHVDVEKTGIAPVLDGIIDEVWDNVDPILIGLDFNGETPTVNAYWKAMWADSGIFVLLNVQDDDHWPAWAAGSGNSWEYDGGEIYFDINTNREDGLGPEHGQGHYSVGPTFEEGQYGVLHSTDLSEWVYRLDGENWTSEHFYRFDIFLNNIGEPMSKAAFLALDSIGFDVYIIDQDEGVTETRNRKVWKNTGTNNENWSSMDDAGTITLVGEPETVNIDIASTGTPPIIDGIIDIVWSTVTPVPIEKNFQAEEPTLTAQWRMLWDNENFYVLIEVQDDNHWPSWEAGGNSWEYDRTEFYLDVNETIKDGLGVQNAGSGHYQIVLDFQEDGYGIPQTVAPTEQNAGGTIAYVLSGTNYVYEFELPFANMHDGESNWMDLVRLQNLGTIGFDITITDQDEGVTENRQRLVWQNVGSIDESWNNMDDCGTITMVGDPPPVRHIEVYKTESAPVIDGIEDAVWDGYEAIPITKSFQEETPTVDAYWKAMWADSGIFVLLNVQDDDHWPAWAAGGNVWEYDGAEVYFDINGELTDGLGSKDYMGHYQSLAAFENGLYGVALTGETNNIGNLLGGWYAHQLNGENWVREFFFPYNYFVNKDGITMDLYEFLSMGEIGFDVTIIDQDEEITSARQRKTWQNEGITDENWAYMDDAGTISLVGGYATEKDSLALVALYNATNGESWNNHDNWLTGDIDTWYGVIISDGRVKELNLGDNNLTGQLPDELGNLTYLIRLYIPGNWNLAGSIPESIGDLKLLYFLDLENCGFTGALPDEIMGLTNLTHLILGNNSFDPAPMPDFSPLVNLTTLSVNNCHFTGSITEGFIQATGLTMINLSGNDFNPASIPDFSGLTSLTNVYMTNCNLTGTIPLWLTQMTSIQELVLPDNDFTEAIPAEIANMIGLRNLDLGNNEFEAGSLPDLSAMVNLVSLWIGNTNRTGTIPAWLGTLTNLQWLNLASNSFTGTLPENFANLTQLLGIYINNNQLSGTLSAYLGDFSSIWDIDFHDNDFTGSIPAEICNLTNISYLDLSGNLLDGTIPTSIGNLDDLWLLDLSSNLLAGNIPAGIGSITGLSTLRLDNNELEGSIPAEIGNLINLSECLLNDNDLSGNIPGAISEAMTPELVIFSGKETVSISKNSFEYLTSSNDELLKISQEDIQTEALTNLNSFYVQNNHFTFADLESSGIEPGDIGTFVYSPQDTTLGLGYLAGTNSLTVFDGKATNNTYQWCHNVEPVTGETNDTIQNIEALGGYYCKVNNLTYPDLELTSELYGIIDYDLETDSLALVAIYQATQGEGWTNHTNWLTGSLDTWFGVTVEGDRVKILEIPENNLNGELPVELGYLTGLVQLNLANNGQLSGNIPTSIGNLTLLEEFRLYYTLITGTMPETMSNLVNLTILDLGWNNFSSGTIPDLSGATNLSNLLLGYCHLTGTIPAWLLSKTSLFQLVIDNNDFTAGPMPDFSGMTQLTELICSQCNFTGDIPTSLLGMSQMRSLNICENDFTAGPMPDFSGMTDLQTLNLSNSNFTGEIPASVGLLTDLWYLDLTGNKLSGEIPSELGNLVNMNTLNLSDNELTGSLPAGFGDMTELRELRLNNNQLNGTIPAGLGNSANLFVLTLENNLFQHVNLEPIMGWANFAGITEFVYSPQGNIGSETSVYTSEGYPAILTIDSYNPSVNDEYQWYKNDVLIPGANGQTLVFGSPALADAGEYYCVVTNTVTTALTLTSLPITLHVGSVGLVGTFNGWGGSSADEPFIQEDEDADLWSLLFTFSSSGEVKFRWNNDWTINWGDNSFPIGTAIQSGANIPVPAGHYQIDFNIATGEYSFEYIDSLALVALYDSTGGASWNNSENWLTGPLATWYGVTVENGRVVGLNLGWDNNLNGTLPEDIGDLTAIKWFIASGNNGLTGNIPTTIGNWTSLQTLGLYNCSLTGTIPAELLTLSQLNLIELSFNDFSAAPMPDFGLLPNLQTLTIENCNFTGDIPAGLSGLSNLQTLYMSGNPNLNQGAVPDLSAATNLTILGMNSCNRSGTIPVWITQFTNLQRLLLEGNSLTGTIPSSFISPENILELNVSWNLLYGESMPDLSLFTNLKILGMAGCGLSGEIPAWITTLTNLDNVNISYNFLEGTIPDNIGNLTNLYHLNIEHNQLTEDVPASFASLTDLHYVYLNNNKLSGNVPDLSGMGNLETLNLGTNLFTFADLAASGIEPDDINTFIYYPQDTLFALNLDGTTLTVLDCQQAGNSYSWYRDNVLQSGTNRSIEVTEDGNYWAIIGNTSYNGLTLYSDTMLIETPVVPEEYQLSSTTVGDSETDCFNAVQTITVAGDETEVTFESGSSVTLIAGYSIRFLRGFHAQSGSYMSAYITETSSFCDALPDQAIVEYAVPETYKSENLEDEQCGDIVGEEFSMRIFPNPSNGMVTLEVKNLEEPVTVRIFTNTGALVHEIKQWSGISETFHFDYLRKGLYFVVVENNKVVKTSKLMIE